MLRSAAVLRGERIRRSFPTPLLGIEKLVELIVKGRERIPRLGMRRRIGRKRGASHFFIPWIRALEEFDRPANDRGNARHADAFVGNRRFRCEDPGAVQEELVQAAVAHFRLAPMSGEQMSGWFWRPFELAQERLPPS